MPPSRAVAVRREREFRAATSAADVARLQERWLAEDEQAERADAAQAKELRALRQRVARLERALRPGGAITDAIIGGVAGAIGPMMKRLDALERKSLHFAGVHELGASYRPGALVVKSGSLWHANVETRATPGQAGSDWTLAVKSQQKGGGLTVA